LIEDLGSGKGFVLLGPPLSGKSRTLYEIVKQMKGYAVLSPTRGKDVPGDAVFSLVTRGRRVILLLEDLNDYVGLKTPLQEFASKLDRYASEWVVASACGDGPEMAVIKATEGTALGRFYRDMIPLKLKLCPLTAQQKEELARSIGVERWDPQQSEWFPTPGSITMDESMKAMRQRFEHALSPEQQDTLRALQLLAFAGVQPFDHRRLRAVLEHERLFDRRGLHLRDCLTALTQQAFILDPAFQDPVRPEPAYLRDTVTYITDRDPLQDFTELADVLVELEDHQGLFYLGIT
jgi:hypothetical protein